MKKTVTLEQKRHFVRHLIDTCDFSDKGGRILHLILSVRRFSENVRFVEDARENAGAGLILASENAQYYNSCLLHKNKRVSFSRLVDLMDRYGEISLQVEFPDKENCREYLDVLESNEVPTNEEASKKISDLIEKNMQLSHIRDKIDDALDRGSEEDFMKFTKIMIEIKKELKEWV